jgi:hypothetical protein
MYVGLLYFHMQGLITWQPDAGFAATVYLMLLVLLTRQMSQSRTPAALARISRWSFLAQALADSISFAGVRILPAHVYVTA